MLNIVGMIISFLLIVTSEIALGDDGSKETIPFLVQERVMVIDSSQASYQARVDVPVYDIQDKLKKVREAVCDTLGDADVRVWLTAEASGGISTIGASAGAGIEVTFHCRDYNDRKNKSK